MPPILESCLYCPTLKLPQRKQYDGINKDKDLELGPRTIDTDGLFIHHPSGTYWTLTSKVIAVGILAAVIGCLVFLCFHRILKGSLKRRRVWRDALKHRHSPTEIVDSLEMYDMNNLRPG